MTLRSQLATVVAVVPLLAIVVSTLAFLPARYQARFRARKVARTERAQAGWGEAYATR